MRHTQAQYEKIAHCLPVFGSDFEAWLQLALAIRGGGWPVAGAETCSGGRQPVTAAVFE